MERTKFIRIYINDGQKQIKINGKERRLTMKNRILTYRKYIDSLLQSDKDCDWKYIKQEHLTQVAFFQHERLVHLIVTITFAILELLTVCAYVIVGAIDSA